MRRLITMAGIAVIVGLIPVTAAAAETPPPPPAEPPAPVITETLPPPTGPLVGGDTGLITVQGKNTCGLVTCTYYFNKQETKDIANATTYVVACGFLAKLGPYAVAACGVVAATFFTQANRAKDRDMCVKVKYIRYLPNNLVPDIYKGKRCK